MVRAARYRDPVVPSDGSAARLAPSPPEGAIFDRVAAIIQDQLDGDTTRNGTVAFGEYFGERTAQALLDAGLFPS